MMEANQKGVSPKNKSLNGQTLVEYALILAFVALTVVALLSVMGQNISKFFTNLTGQIQTVTQ